MRKKSGKCVHCLRVVDQITDDHVLPRAWYPPKTTPPNLKKWVAPACHDCNHELGKVEEGLRIKMALCLDPTDVRTLGLSEDILRAIKPQFAKTEKERQFRTRQRNRIIRECRELHPNSDGILPGFGKHPGQEHRSKVPAILIPADDVATFAQKVLRGVYYALFQKYVEQGYESDIFFVHDMDVQDNIALLNKLGNRYDIGPGLEVKIAVADNDPSSVFCKIVIWGKWPVWGAVSKPDLSDKVI